jgi:hypothetical protein
VVKIEFTPLSLDRKIFPFKKGFKKHNLRSQQSPEQCGNFFSEMALPL